MPWRSEISARDTGPVCACKAKSSMAVTAYRPFVVSLMDKYQGVSEWEQVCDSRVFKSTIRPSTLVRNTRKKGARIIAGWGGMDQREQGQAGNAGPMEVKMWEQACSRMRWISQYIRRLTRSFREQARSHMGFAV